MSISVLSWICALFMIGRNLPSLFFKLRDLVITEKRKQWTQTPTKFFTLIILIITAISGLICGISILFPNLVFGYYMFFGVSGMMIYSYFTYAGSCYEEKKWFMFGVCIFVIIFTATLMGVVSFQLSTGILD